MWSRLVAEPRRVAMAKHTRLVERVQKTKLQIKLAKQQVKRLKQWRARSLPIDVQSARSLYQGWLNHLVKSAGLEQRVFDSGSPVSRSGLLVLPFTVRGTGSMAQLTELKGHLLSCPWCLGMRYLLHQKTLFFLLALNQEQTCAAKQFFSSRSDATVKAFQDSLLWIAGA